MGSKQPIGVETLMAVPRNGLFNNAKTCRITLLDPMFVAFANGDSSTGIPMYFPVFRSIISSHYPHINPFPLEIAKNKRFVPTQLDLTTWLAFHTQ